MFRDKVLETLLNQDFRKVELEFRIGIQDTSFHPNISKQKWTAAKNKFQDGTDTHTIELYVPSKQNESSRFVANMTNNRNYWQYKMKLAQDTKTFGKYSVRSALALETTEEGDPPQKVSMQRKKYRTTFVKVPWKIDFTRVISIPTADKDCEETYEIEVELLDLSYLFWKEIDIIIEDGINLCKNLI